MSQMGNTKLGFMNVPNGDVIAFDMKESEINPSVVYLSHDDGEGHGYILGKDFNTYLEQLLLVGCDFGKSENAFYLNAPASES